MISDPSPSGSFYEGIALLGAAIGWGIRELIPVLKKRWARKQVSRAKMAYRGVGAIIDALEEGRNKGNSCRAMFLISRNSGGIPSPGVQVKVSVRYEATADGARRIHEDFQDWAPDAPYCELLSRLANSGGTPIVLTTATMPKGMLQDLYTSDGHVGSVVVLLGHVPDGNWMAYASFNYREEDVEIVDGEMALSPEQSEVLRSSVTKMRNTLREFYEVLV